jgi:hypothetical protein
MQRELLAERQFPEKFSQDTNNEENNAQSTGTPAGSTWFFAGASFNP